MEYDSLLAKLIAWGPDREQARRRLMEALRELVLLGPTTNQSFLLQILESDAFRKGETFTTTLEESHWEEPSLPKEILTAAEVWMSSDRSPRNPDAPLPGPWEGLGGFRVGG